jgi:quercetin dioxygenase-like cupin family protein
MEITRFDQTSTYEAPKHFGMTARRLQGLDVTAAENFSVGLSTFEPAGGCESGSTPFEKIYVVLEGEISVAVAAGSFRLGKYDSCRIEPNESRTMLNESDAPAQVLVIIPTVRD